MELAHTGHPNPNEAPVSAANATGQESLYRALFDLLPTSVILVDLDGRVRDVNPAFCRWMGFAREELIGIHVSHFSNDAPGDIERNLARLGSGELLDHEVVNRQKDGTLRHYEIRERAVDLPDGTRGILVVANDITDRKTAENRRLELERSLLRAQKLESLGVLAGGIAHDFNNLLQIILGNLELASMPETSLSTLRDSLGAMAEAGKRAADLTQMMLDYSGRGQFITKPVEIAELTKDLLRTMQSWFAQNVSIEFQTIDDLPTIQADPAQVTQVLKSLLVNAVEALPESGGTVRVSIDAGYFDARSLETNRTDQPAEPGNYVALEITDTGIGMTDDVRQRMFEPFFSTKFAGRGLGMAAVLGIVRGHQGALFVESPPDGGTTVRVLFPAGTSAHASIPPAGSGMQPPSPHATGRLAGTVLVAEDEGGIRMLMEELLQDMGLKVIAVPTGELAVERFQENSAEISFVILDLVLPGITGVETLARLRSIRPDIRAVLTSGYQRKAIKGFQDEAGFIDFIQKPYDIDTFRQVVGAVAAKLSDSR